MRKTKTTASRTAPYAAVALPCDAPVPAAARPCVLSRDFVRALHQYVRADDNPRTLERLANHLFGTLRALLFNRLARRQRCRNRAEDVAQQALLQAFRSLRSCKALEDPEAPAAPAQVWTWFCTIADHAACDEGKSVSAHAARVAAARKEAGFAEVDRLRAAPPQHGYDASRVEAAIVRALRDACDTILRVVAGVESWDDARSQAARAEVGGSVPSAAKNIRAWVRVRLEGVPTADASPEPGDAELPRKAVQDRTSQRVARGARAVALGALLAARRGGDLSHRSLLVLLANRADPEFAAKHVIALDGEPTPRPQLTLPLERREHVALERLLREPSRLSPDDVALLLQARAQLAEVGVTAPGLDAALARLSEPLLRSAVLHGVPTPRTRVLPSDPFGRSAVVLPGPCVLHTTVALRELIHSRVRGLIAAGRHAPARAALARIGHNATKTAVQSECSSLPISEPWSLGTVALRNLRSAVFESSSRTDAVI